MFIDAHNICTPLPQLLQSIQKGEVILLIDDSGRTLSCYLFCAASIVTPDTLCEMINLGRSVILAAMPKSRLKDLGLPMMTAKTAKGAPELAVSVEARQGVSSGISAADRALTLRSLGLTKQPRLDLVTPGHIFPLRTKDGGVLVRTAAPEAAVDLLLMSGMPPVAAFCHCLNTKGDTLSADEIQDLASSSTLKVAGVADVIRERLAKESVIEQIAKATLPTQETGEFAAYCYRSLIDGSEHIALVKGDLEAKDDNGCPLPMLVRVQAEQRIGDLLGTRDAMSRDKLRQALKAIEAAGRGIFVYVRHPSKSSLSEMGQPLTSEPQKTSPAAQLREYGIGAQILRNLGAKRIRLLSSSSHDLAGIRAFQIEIVEQVNF